MSFRREFQILSDRYFDCVLGDFTSLLWTLGQAPLIALLIIMRWDGIQATETLYYVIALSAHWFGLINACREIAKEDAIFRRERLFDISIAAYLFSKYKILALLGVIETLVFYIILESQLVLDLNPAMAFGSLFVLYLSGMTLGLLVSAVASSPAKAVISVPLAILPQIIFSRLIMSEDTMSDASRLVAKATPVKWGFDSLVDIADDKLEIGSYLGNLSALALGAIVMTVVTLFYLKVIKD